MLWYLSLPYIIDNSGWLAGFPQPLAPFLINFDIFHHISPDDLERVVEHRSSQLKLFQVSECLIFDSTQREPSSRPRYWKIGSDRYKYTEKATTMDVSRAFALVQLRKNISKWCIGTAFYSMLYLPIKPLVYINKISSSHALSRAPLLSPHDDFWSL